MSRASLASLMLACLLLPCGVVRAGVYVVSTDKDNPLREPFPLPTDYDAVKSRLLDLASLSQPPGMQAPEDSLRVRVLNWVTRKLEPQLKSGELSLQGRVDLTGCYIRLGRHAVAFQLLETTLAEVKDDAPERFLLLANLASAYEGLPELLPRAISTQKSALAAAPVSPPVAGWSQAQWDRYRIAERYDLMLLELRYREVVVGRAAGWKAVDALFPTVRFVGPSGDYEAGKLSAESLHELPRDALPIVVQLLYWLPADVRLHWLYGELLNAEGRINEAYRALDYLRTGRGLSSLVEMGKHRLVLKESVVPDKKDEDVPEEKSPPDEPKKAEDKSAKGMPDWRTLGAGFLAGVLVALFGCVQVYIWLRRRRAPATGHMTTLRDHS